MRRCVLIGSIALLAGCEPDIPQNPPAASINTAVFDLSAGEIPQPNDLSLQAAALATLPNNAQKELLTSFATAGGFPNDQEVPVTFQLQRVNVDSAGKVTIVAPQLDVATITSMTLVALRVDGTPAPVELEPVTASDYVVNGNQGTLTVHNKGRNSWPAGGQFVFAMRGGAQGVKGQNGEPIQPSTTFFLLLQNTDLSQPQNTALLPGTRSQQLQEGQQLEAIRQSYQPVYAALNALGLPQSDIAVLTTFKVASATAAFVEMNPGGGQLPLPSNFLLDDSGQHVRDIPAFGALAPGIATLDGFSTTGPITAQTSAPIQADTVTANTVLLYDLTDPSHPALVPDATATHGVYVTEPSAVVQSVMGVNVSTVIALQPAIPFSGMNGPVALPPLKEDTTYAVVITNGVKDLNQKGLTLPTLGRIVLLQQPITNSSGQSQLAGVDNATAAGLEQMRLALRPVVAQAQTDKSVAADQIAAAYTFRTQTITGKNSVGDSSKTPGLLQLAALPYSDAEQSKNFTPGAVTVMTPAEAFARYGIDPSVVPDADLAEVIDTTVPTINLLSDTTGAFDPSQRTPEILKTLIAVPNPAVVPACPTGGPFPSGALCAPLVIFHHGLGASRGSMLTVANELAKNGFVVAAIDAPKHGDRSWCSADNQCAAGSLCTPIPGGAGQGDAIPPGTCSGGLAKAPILCATADCQTAWAAAMPQEGVALASSNYLVSANLFRTRDSFRQDVIDQSALILALARPPQLPVLPQTSTVVTELGTKGIVINPGEVYWVGQSLGAILGTLNVAANPRISRAVLNVGGGTVVDVLTNAPAFTTTVSALLTSLGLQPGTPAYFQFLLVAKWVLDPAEPVNVAGNLLGDADHPTLPDLLASMPSQAGKKVLGQLAACDTTVPNAFNLELGGLIGLAPVSMTASTLELFVNTNDAGGSCPLGVAATSPGTVPNGFFTSWGISVDSMGMTSEDTSVQQLTKIAQDQSAAFLTDPTQLPPPTQTQP